MSDDAAARARPVQRPVGSFAPHVPYLTSQDNVDRGPAGSLVQARARERALRTAARRPATRDPLAWAGAAFCAAALGSWAAAYPRLGTELATGLVLLILAGLAAAAAVAAVGARYRVGEVEVDLCRQIAAERRAARALDALRSSGWTVLHDRLVPGTEHRVAHVLAGPAGLVVATVLPVAGPPRMRGAALMSGEVSLAEWFATRWWETRGINDAVTARLAHWPWEGPTYPVALVLEENRRGWPLPLARRRSHRPPSPEAAAFPPAYQGIAIEPAARIRAWVATRPAPLGRLAAAELAAELEAACPPAATRA